MYIIYKYIYTYVCFIYIYIYIYNSIYEDIIVVRNNAYSSKIEEVYISFRVYKTCKILEIRAVLLYKLLYEEYMK